MTEHLQRVTHARRHFRDEAAFLGFDDRGRIYVRLGPPSQRRELSSQRLAASVSIHSHFLPRNEYWHYDALGRHGHYIFVKDGHRYVLGGVVDLLPSDLRHRKKGTGVLTALALHDLYDALVPRVTEYAPLFDRISDEVARLSAVASQRSTTLTRMADANSDPGGTGARYARFPPSLLDRARRVDHTVAQRRAETVPASRSNVAMREGRLPVAVRLARFRAADGTTDVNAYWSIRCRPLPTDAVATPERRGEDHRDRQHHIRLTTRRYDRSYAANAVVRSAHTLPSCATPTPSTNARVVSTALPSPHGLQHFALQWDQLVQPHGAPPHTVRRAQSGVHWVDSLRALPATDDSLVLSDPVPLQAATVDSIPLRDDAGFQAQPYPFATVDPDMRLGVYLEAYNLTHDTDDRTRYTVAYAVRRDVPPDGWAGAFRAAKTETTSTRITRRGSSRTAHEYLEIDLRPFRHATALVLLIRVTDTVTDDTADRVLPFRVDDGLLK